jgi:CheY-like chemotaxis protein/HPt (histidine-containing phosphotransfer) domain-containing protein
VKEVAEVSNRAKSAFLATMSHELRTPLTALLGFADLLTSPSLGESDRLNYTLIIRRNGEHLLSLINDILDLSKIEAGKLSLERIDCNPAQILSDVEALMRVRAAESGLDFGVSLKTLVPATVRTDPTRLQQILLNLVSNAVKFTQRGGVRVEVRYDPGPAGSRPSLAVDVIDTGIGMSPEQLKGLFQPFHQVDVSMRRRFGGTGLGLAICKHLATALGGDISVKSTPGQGSTFTLSLPVEVPPGAPLIESLSETPSDLDAPLRTRPLERLRGSVLLVEDGPDNQVLLSTILRGLGLSVTLAENGQLGVERATGGSFDLILMDMQMPVLDGYGATRALRRQNYRGTIIALTAHALISERERCLSAGCDDYLSKPIDRKALLALLARYLARAEEPAPRQAASPPEAPLRSSYADDPEMAELIARFVQSLPARVEELRASQPGAMIRLAHQLKGAAGGYGFAPITETASRLEQALQESRPDTGALLEELVLLCQRARA